LSGTSSRGVCVDPPTLPLRHLQLQQRQQHRGRIVRGEIITPESGNAGKRRQQHRQSLTLPQRQRKRANDGLTTATSVSSSSPSPSPSCSSSPSPASPKSGSRSPSISSEDASLRQQPKIPTFKYADACEIQSKSLRRSCLKPQPAAAEYANLHTLPRAAAANNGAQTACEEERVILFPAHESIPDILHTNSNGGDALALYARVEKRPAAASKTIIVNELSDALASRGEKVLYDDV